MGCRRTVRAGRAAAGWAGGSRAAQRPRSGRWSERVGNTLAAQSIAAAAAAAAAASRDGLRGVLTLAYAALLAGGRHIVCSRAASAVDAIMCEREGLAICTIGKFLNKAAILSLRENRS